MLEKGLFIVFEGIDKSGKNFQIHELEKRIESLNKHQDILRTQEPWRSEEINRKLKQDKSAYSNQMNLAELFIDDRARHTQRLIRPNIEAGTAVLCSRYKMSTCAYQWTQGVELSALLKMHDNRGILTPDLTFFLDISRETAEKRGAMMEGKKEKFEKDAKFIYKLISAYNCQLFMSEVDERIFGKVERIDGSREPEAVADEIYGKFVSLYKKR